ncbi:Fanconi anemia group J protein [Mortierella antarctica]|nr:Fanconi anemia group J protein [Mortierella antarctica]
MAKRKRTLPQESSKAKAASPGGSGSSAARGKQSRLAIHVVEDNSDSNSDTINSASSRKNSPKPGQFVQSRKKRQKTPTANSSASKTAAAPTVFATRGVSIRFPFVPYQSQQDMMSKIVEALQKKENALLESPTGSGKSLALLCGALAWLETEKENRRKEWKVKTEALEKELAKQGVVESPYFSNDSNVGASTPAPALTTAAAGKEKSGCGPCQGSCSTDAQDTVKTDLPQPALTSPLEAKAVATAPGRQDESSEDDEDFEPQMKAERRAHREAVEINYECETPGSDKTKVNQDEEGARQDYNSQTLPKIYFGTRTHKQITQLVKELKSNTGYRPEMVVLGSRNHYCINPALKKAVNKNDGCQDLLEDPFKGCLWKHNVRELETTGLGRIWDMEDMIAYGKSKRACPYFASRSIAQRAELIFCPYSYLIDPQIRKAMDIDLDNAIVILDEAHNIEDAARDAGGLDLLDKDLWTAKAEFEDMLASMFLTILEDQTTFKIQEYEQSTEIWTSQELLASLEEFGVTRRTIRDYDNACQEISRELKEQKEKARLNKLRGLTDRNEKDDMHEMDEESTDKRKPKKKKRLVVSPAVLRAMEEIVIILKRLLGTEYDCRDDYRIAMVESLDRTDAANRNTTVVDGDSSEGEGGNAGTQRTNARSGASRYANSQSRAMGRNGAYPKKREFKFWCLNPGVIFRPLSMKTRSVILTSGTLSPMDSFASELQASFPIRLEAGHVVDQSQVWTGVLPYGPTKVKIDGTYRSVNSFAFQDELGTVVERIIKATPHGVLCFVSSYMMLEKLMSRWKDTGEYAKLCRIKKIFQEPKMATAKAFDQTLRQFYHHISSEVSKGSDGGALLFAVFRGKCSEGIDFTDSNCRAVLAVGIPFPHLKDLKIQLKKEYNDQQCLRQRQLRHLQLHGPQGAGAQNPLAHVNLQGLDHTAGTSATSASDAVAINQQMQITRTLLSGNRWYEIQAFRAYNQAIGRCIRHRKDWGAMVLLDSRFTMPNNKQNLSKWVRPLVKTFVDFEQGIKSITDWITPLQKGIITPTEPSVIAPPASMLEEENVVVIPELVPETSVPSSEVALLQALAAQAAATAGAAATLPSTVKDESPPPPLVPVETPPLLPTEAPRILSQTSMASLLDVGGPALEIQQRRSEQDWDIHSDDSMAAELDGEIDEPSLYRQPPLLLNVLDNFENGVDSFSFLDASSQEVTSMFESLTDAEEQPISMDIQCNKSSASQGAATPAHTTPVTVSTASPDQPLALISSSVFLPADPDIRRLSYDCPPSDDSGPLAETVGPMEPAEPPEPTVLVSSSPATPASNQAGSAAPPNRPLAPIFSPAFSPVQSNAQRLSFGRLPSSDNNPLAGNVDRARTAAAASAYNIICKTCTKHLFSCSDKPKIKAIRKCMANDLYLHFQQRRQAQQAVHPKLAAASPCRTFTRTLSESSLNGDAGTQSRNILTVSPSFVLELTPEIQGDQEEIECVWQPQDGLCYRRIICPRCSLAAAPTATGNATTSSVDGSPRLISGWRGVMVVGASYGQGSAAESTETGTIWLIQGEFQVV